MLGRLSLDRFHAGRHCSGPNDVLAAQYRSAAARGLIVFCIAFPLMGAPRVMADQIAGETQATSAQHANQDIGLLLLKVEQQIAAGHAVDPESDNALDTWQAVITKAHPASPETLKALVAFAAHMRDRAETEKAAGRLLVSTDFSAFAGAANDLLKDVAPTSSPQGSQANASRSAGTVQATSGSSAPTTGSATVGPAPPVAGGLAQQAARPQGANQPAQPIGGHIAPGESPPAAATGANATRTPTPATQTSLAAAPPAAPPAGPAAPGNSPPADANATRTPLPTTQTALSAAPPVPPPVTRAPTTLEQSVAALYASRGDQMLAIKDLSAARRFYEYAANAGSARAATALAMTFDPSFLSHLGVIGLRPDPAQAAVWYHKAAELGDRNAETRLHSLSTETAK